MSVDVRGLKITIGGKPIVSDADMTIADGERVGLIGSSGSGKSMIAKAMLGLLPLTAVTNGSIDMAARKLSELPNVRLPTCAAGMWVRYSRIRPMR